MSTPLCWHWQSRECTIKWRRPGSLLRGAYNQQCRHPNMRVYSCAQMEGRRSVNAIVSALTAFRVHDQVGSKTAVDACFAVGSHQSCRGGGCLLGLPILLPWLSASSVKPSFSCRVSPVPDHNFQCRACRGCLCASQASNEAMSRQKCHRPGSLCRPLQLQVVTVSKHGLLLCTPCLIAESVQDRPASCIASNSFSRAAVDNTYWEIRPPQWQHMLTDMIRSQRRLPTHQFARPKGGPTCLEKGAGKVHSLLVLGRRSRAS